MCQSEAQEVISIAPCRPGLQNWHICRIVIGEGGRRKCEPLRTTISNDMLGSVAGIYNALKTDEEDYCIVRFTKMVIL